MKTKRSISGLQIFLIPFLVIAFFVGLSFVGSDRKDAQRITFDSSGFNKVYATEDLWFGVRGAASLARSANISINTIVTSLSYVLNFLDSINIIIPDPIFNAGIGDYWYKLYRNTPLLVSGNTYTGRLEIWKINAGPSYTKALEFYWDDINDPTASQGILLIINPYQYDPLHFYAGEMYEVRYKLDPSGNKTMVISFIGATGTPDGFWYNDQALIQAGIASDGCLTRGLIRFTDVTANNWYEFAGVTKRECGCGNFTQGSTSYYTLSYLAYKASPYYSTARFGHHATDAGTDPLSFNLCVLNPNPLNYGYYSTFGFGGDGKNSDDGIHPNRADVDAISFDSSDNEIDVTRTALEAKTIALGVAAP